MTLGCQTQKIQTVADESEANEILDLLLSYDIPATKEKTESRQESGYEIRIGGGEKTFSAAIRLLEDHCLPRRFPEEVKSRGLIASPTEERARESRRSKINIESQLRKVPGTTCVDVNIVAGKKSELESANQEASATALVKFKTEKYSSSKEQVAKMIAASVPGLDAEKVVVTLTRQPLRPLPDFRNETSGARYLWILGGSTLTFGVFLLGVIVLRKRRLAETSTGLAK